MMRRSRRGLTVVELVVVLALLALLSGLVAAAMPAPRAPSGTAEELQALRRAAVASGRAVSRELHGGGAPRLATALPDGRVIVDSGLAPVAVEDPR